ncbi:EcWRKY-42, partial [Eragrostis curvula]
MASPHMKSEQSFDFGDSSTQEVMGSASESYSPPGSGFGLSPPESSPPDDGRRRRKDRPTWAKYTYTPDLDGHLWRKYGQKKIKDADFPRLYYRCSYRDDRRCLASKLMQQQNNEDPPLYHVTYTYEHTCGAPPVPLPDIMVEEPPPSQQGQGLVLRFDSPGHQQWQPSQSTSPSPYMMLNFGASSQQPVFRSDPGAGSSSSSFPTEAAAPASMNGGGDMCSPYNSFSYDFNDHMHFGDHGHVPYNNNNDDDDY